MGLYIFLYIALEIKIINVKLGNNKYNVVIKPDQEYPVKVEGSKTFLHRLCWDSKKGVAWYIKYTNQNEIIAFVILHRIREDEYHKETIPAEGHRYTHAFKKAEELYATLMI